MRKMAAEGTTKSIEQEEILGIRVSAATKLPMLRKWFPNLTDEEILQQETKKIIRIC